MARHRDEMDVFKHFDPCMGVLKQMIRNECHVCPLASTSIDKVIEDFEKYVRYQYLANSHKYPLTVAARVSIKEGFEHVDICFKEADYPVTRSHEEIKNDGIPTNQLHSGWSSEHFLSKSICPTQIAKMIAQDISRFMRVILKPTRLIKFS